VHERDDISFQRYVSWLVRDNTTWKNYVDGTDEWLHAAALAKIRRELPALAEEVVSAIQLAVPEYARPLSGEFGRGIRSGTELALRRFIGDELDDSSQDVYRRLGAGEYRAGRSLDALQSAYRVGARVAWRRISQAAEAANATPRAQRNLAEAMFAYIEHIASESVDGYAEAQLRAARDLDQRRNALVGAVLGTVAPVDGELARAAEVAHWALPRSVACLAVGGEFADQASRRLSGDALTVRFGDTVGIIVPNPAAVESEARQLAERLQLVVGLGPVVVLGDAPASMRLARRALELASPEEPLAVADQRLAEIALHAAPEVVSALNIQLLAPLRGETPASRARLEETLLEWLRQRGSQRAIASTLAIHPQTARYRIRRLRELFGPVLEDPEHRFALEMALRYARHTPRDSSARKATSSSAPLAREAGNRRER
jgi:hypothetical protein